MKKTRLLSNKFELTKKGTKYADEIESVINRMITKAVMEGVPLAELHSVFVMSAGYCIAMRAWEQSIDKKGVS